MKTYATAKIHGLEVEECCLDYEGSITLPREIMALAGIGHLELVHVNGYRDGAHWETYAIPGDTVQLNGPPYHLFCPGDEIVVVRYELLEEPPAGILKVLTDDEDGPGFELEQRIDLS